MAETIEKLRAMPREDLIREHDTRASHTMVGTNHYLAELERRDREDHDAAIRALTIQMKTMTLIVTAAAIVQAVASVLALLKK